MCVCVWGELLHLCGDKHFKETDEKREQKTNGGREALDSKVNQKTGGSLDW